MRDLVEFLSVACTGTGQRTFYNTRKEQEAALGGMHQRLLASDRRTYALIAGFPINDRNRQLICENLLSSAKEASDLDLEDHVVAYVMQQIQFNRVLNMLCELVDQKVNNSRTRRIIRFVWKVLIDEYRAIKYRDKVRRLLRHAHIPERYTSPNEVPEWKVELHQWIYGKITRPSQVKHAPKLKARLRARTEYEAIFELPFDIARDIAMCQHGKTAEQFAKDFAGTQVKEAKGKATRKETMRAKSASKDVVVDYRRFDLIELLNRLYRNPDEYGEIASVLDMKAAEVAQTVQLPERVALVVDNSRSSQGSGERLFHPVAVMEAVVRVCKAMEDTDATVFYVGPEMDRWLKAEGASNLRMALARALASRPELVLILSDGYENVRAGSVSQILQTKAVKNSGIGVVHLNPVTAAETKDVRRLASDLPTYGLLGPAQLPLTLLLGQAEANPELLAPLFDALESAFKDGDYKAVKSVMRSTPALQTV